MSRSYPIVFDETKIFPFSLIFQKNNNAINIQETNRVFQRPITIADGSMCKYLSISKKQLLDQQIYAIQVQEREIQNSTGPLMVSNTFGDLTSDLRNQQVEQNYLINTSINNHLRKLRYFRHQNEDLNPPIDIRQNRILFCFLYQDETLQQINLQILSNFTQIGNLQQRIYVILVNDQKNLHQSIASLINNPIIFNNVHNSGKIIEYQLNENTNIFFIITNIEQKYADLLKWIYLGIFEYFDAKYCLVAPLNYVDNQFQCDQMFKLLEANINIASVNGCIEFKSDDSFSVKSGLAKLLNLSQRINSINQVQDIITSHNPLFSFYRWNSIKPYIHQCVEAFTQLEIQQNSYSTIFPLFNNYHKQDQLYITLNKYVCTKTADLNCIQEHRRQFKSTIKQNEIINKLAIPHTPQNSQSLFRSLLKLKEDFVEYFSISIYFYIVFINSYQLILKNQNNQAISAFIPIILIFISIILTILMMILPFLYSMEQVILKKTDKTLRNVYAHKPRQRVQYVSQSELDNSQYHQFKNQMQIYWQRYFMRNHLRISRQIEYLGLQDICLNIGQFTCPTVYQLVDEYKQYFKLSALLNIGFGIIIILNFVITYNDINNIENIVRLVIGGILLLIALSQYQNILYFQVYYIFLQYYNLLQQIKSNPTNYYKYLPKMLRQLIINSLCLAIMYIIEQNTNYQAYIFLGLIIYFLFTYIFDGVLYVRKQLKERYQYQNIHLSEDDINLQQINQGQIDQYQNNILQTDQLLQDLNQNSNRQQQLSRIIQQ